MTTETDNMSFCDELGCVNSTQPGRQYCDEHHRAAQLGQSLLKESVEQSTGPKILAGPMAEEFDDDEETENRRSRARSRGGGAARGSRGYERALSRGAPTGGRRQSKQSGVSTVAEQTRNFWSRGRSRTAHSNESYRRAKTPHNRRNSGTNTERAAYNRSKSRPAARRTGGGSIFDRLSDPRSFTKAYAARRDNDTQEVNPDNFFQSFRGSRRDKAPRKWNPMGKSSSGGTFGSPLDGTVPAARSSSQSQLEDTGAGAGGGSGGGSVFSRLTNSRSFTGVQRQVHAERTSRGHSGSATARPSSAAAPSRLIHKMLTDFVRVLHSKDPLNECDLQCKKLHTVLRPDDQGQWRSRVTLTAEEKQCLDEVLTRHVNATSRDRSSPTVVCLDATTAPSSHSMIQQLKSAGPDKLDQLLRQIFRFELLGEEHTLKPPRRAINVTSLTDFVFAGDGRAYEKKAGTVYKIQVGDYAYIGKAGQDRQSASSRLCAMVRAAYFAGTDTDKSFELCQALRTTHLSEWRGEILVQEEMTDEDLEMQEQVQIFKHKTQWPHGLNIVVNAHLKSLIEAKEKSDSAPEPDPEAQAKAEEDLRTFTSQPADFPTSYEESVLDADDEVSVLESVSEKPSGVDGLLEEVEEDDDDDDPEGYDQDEDYEHQTF